jgi:hypothetical protein
MDPQVTRPIAGLDAFTSADRSAAWSASAQLLLIAGKLVPRDYAGPANSPPEAADVADVADVADAEAIGVPHVRPLDVRPLDAGDSSSLDSRVSSSRASRETKTAAYLWSALEETAEPLTAVALLLNQLDSPSQIIRVSAATALLAVSTETDRARSTLAGIRRFGSPTARAMTALAIGSAGAPPSARVAVPMTGDVSVGITGSFGRWREPQLTPGGPLFRLLKEEVSPNLYADAASYFRWAGGYSEASRRDAARDFSLWLKTSGAPDRLDSVFAHSHSGNVALNAVTLGVPMRFLVLIGTPALHRPEGEWSTISRRLGRAISLRSRLDLVLLLDRLLGGGPEGPGSGGPTFGDAFNCRVLAPPVWFSHTALLRPSVWREFDLVEEIRFEHSLA